MPSLANALTIDVEEHFQVHGFASVIGRHDWDGLASRVVPNTRRVLDLLAEHDVRATFFVLGWIADRFPGLVEEIATRGHEVATHGYWHELVYRQTPTEFAADLQASLDALAVALGDTPIAGYRAPAFSITRRSFWALDILRDHGIRYDSSIFPLLAHDRYGVRDAPRFANRLDGGLWEFPVSTVRVGPANVPVAGGGYFRLWPLWLTRRSIRGLNQSGCPAVVYLHPWEFDPDQPRVPGAPPLARVRHYLNLDRTEARLRALLEAFSFAPMKEAFRSHLESVA